MQKTKYQVEDEEILSAIRYHTTGHPDMTVLEKIIYLAVNIDPGVRWTANHIRFRKSGLLVSKIWIMGALCIENGISYLREQNQPIDTISLETYEWYQKGITL